MKPSDATSWLTGVLVRHLDSAATGARVFPASTGARVVLTSRVIALSCVLCLGGLARAGGIAINDDLFIGVWSPFASRWEAETPVCIWGDTAGESYRIIATGLSSDSDFVLSSDNDENIAYRVQWFPQSGGGRRDRLTPGVPSRSIIAADSNPECSGGANASIRVTIRRRQIDRAPPGIYDDTLLVILSPL